MLGVWFIFLMESSWIGFQGKANIVVGWKEGNVLINEALNTFYLWLYGIGHIVKETLSHPYMGYSFWLAARGLLYSPSQRQYSTHHSLCYTSCRALAGTRNSSVGPPWRIDLTTHRTVRTVQLQLHYYESHCNLQLSVVILYKYWPFVYLCPWQMCATTSCSECAC